MDELSADARQRLIEIARASANAAMAGRSAADLPLDAREGELAQHGGCFVTLKTHGDLRGCLGHFEADAPIPERVREMAAASAAEDPRFIGNRLCESELAALEIEISVLSPRLAPESWRDSNTEVMKFSAQVFGTHQADNS